MALMTRSGKPGRLLAIQAFVVAEIIAASHSSRLSEKQARIGVSGAQRREQSVEK